MATKRRRPFLPEPDIICKVCDGGRMIPCNIYRMSPPVVVIGYIFLIPSLLALASIIAACVSEFGSSADDAIYDLIAIIIWCVILFPSTLIGWLLTMKKRVLQCQYCGATVAAS